MKTTALPVLVAIAAAGSPALAAPQTWTCRIERVIVDSKTSFPNAKARSSSSGQFRFEADTETGTGCLRSVEAGGGCLVAYTGAIEGGGVVRLAATDASGTLDLVNIWTSSGRFVRLKGGTQWMGQPGDCVKSAS
jgi:hypothetical protein